MTHVQFIALFNDYLLEHQERIELAYILSKDAHRSQTRIDGERYFEHPRRVALILLQEVGVKNPDDICAALLHDTIEDTKYITESKLRRWLNWEIATLVVALSKVPGKTQRHYFDTLGEWPRAAIIKGCDRLDNMRSLAATEPEFQWKQVHSTTKFVMPMLEKVRCGSTHHGEQAAKLMDLIRVELAKFPKLNDPYYPQNQKEA
jgi:GTP pyrophosphokinase